MLAAGCSDGRCIIYDFDTRGIACTFFGHRRAVISLSWDESSKFLVTGSRDGSVIIWNLKERQRLATLQFDLPVCSCDLHPRERCTLNSTLPLSFNFQVRNCFGVFRGVEPRHSQAQIVQYESNRWNSFWSHLRSRNNRMQKVREITLTFIFSFSLVFPTTQSPNSTLYVAKFS